MDTPYDEKDYPSLGNMTYDALKEIFGLTVNSSCHGMNNSLMSLAKINNTDEMKVLKDLVSKMEDLQKEKLNEFAFRFRFPENPKDPKEHPSGCSVND